MSTTVCFSLTAPTDAAAALRRLCRTASRALLRARVESMVVGLRVWSCGDLIRGRRRIINRMGAMITAPLSRAEMHSAHFFLILGLAAPERAGFVLQLQREREDKEGEREKGKGCSGARGGKLQTLSTPSGVGSKRVRKVARGLAGYIFFEENVAKQLPRGRRWQQ